MRKNCRSSGNKQLVGRDHERKRKVVRHSPDIPDISIEKLEDSALIRARELSPFCTMRENSDSNRNNRFQLKPCIPMYPVSDRSKSVIPTSIVIPSNCAMDIRREESRLNLQFKLSAVSCFIQNY